jgi:plastocyanin
MRDKGELIQSLALETVSNRRWRMGKFSRRGFLSTAIAAMTLTVACAGPATTRTGVVHDIRVAEGPVPDDLIVNPGDEVRWVNSRTLPMRVDLVNVNPNDVSCERGFTNMFNTFKGSATVKPNETASACFVQAGVVSYNLRMDSALPGGQKIVPGVVRIGTKP